MNKPTDKRFQDITGVRFSGLVVITYVGKDKSGNSRWLCQCDCGNEKIVLGGNLKNGHTKSCGCLHRGTITKHGHSRSDALATTEYRSWRMMKTRCMNPNTEYYKDWGGRGITVCERWLNSFENFLADMGEKPTKKHSIDRVDNAKGYSPENCKWSTSTEQNNNRRDNRFITHNNETLTLAEWAGRTGIKYKTLHMRLKNGWSTEMALQKSKQGYLCHTTLG